MTLRELIEALSAANPGQRVAHGFSRPHSYRGNYCDLAFVPTENVLVCEMLRDAEAALGATYHGWKGGQYTMGEYTDVYIANIGECGDPITHACLREMLRDDAALERRCASLRAALEETRWGLPPALRRIVDTALTEDDKNTSEV